MFTHIIQILRRFCGVVSAANESVVGTHPNGLLSLKASAAIAARDLLVALSSGKAATGAANTVPVGVVQDAAAAEDDIVPVALLGNTPGTLKMTAAGAISVGDTVVAAASGKVQTLPETAGTYYAVGVALTAAAASGDIVEVAHKAPVAVTVSE